MSGLTVDASHERSALLAGQRHGPGGLADWACDLARLALSSLGLQAEILVSTSPENTESLVEVRMSGQSVLLIDVDENANDQASIDRLELLAARTWRGVTRTQSRAGSVPGWVRSGSPVTPSIRSSSSASSSSSRPASSTRRVS